MTPQMRKYPFNYLCLGIAFGLLGCGGSGDSHGTNGGDTQAALYQAALPDGSPMILELSAGSGGVWSGGFEVDATTGTYADQTGAFGGGISGATIRAQGITNKGQEFDLTGTATTNGFQLTRSDIPGVVLNFSRIASAASETRSTVSCHVTMGGTTGLATFSTTPEFTSSSGMKSYAGSLNGVRIFMVVYPNHTTSLECNLGVNTANTISTFNNYTIDDVATKTITASPSYVVVSSYTISKVFIGEMAARCSP